jgi:hypothetical protein
MAYINACNNDHFCDDDSVKTREELRKVLGFNYLYVYDDEDDRDGIRQKIKVRFRHQQLYNNDEHAV